MGSYLSILNNTADEYSVRVGIDEAAVRVINIVMLAVTAVTLTIASLGLAAPAVATAATGAVVIAGITAKHLVAITSIAASLTGVTIAADAAGLALAVSIFIAQELENEHFVRIRPGAKQRFGRYTLSLWRQGTCRRVRPNPRNSSQLIMDTVFMRPIFTGATVGSTIVHDIQFWINRFGHEEETFIQIPLAETPARSAAAIDEAIAEYKDVDWGKLVQEAKAKAKAEVLAKAGLDAQEQYDVTAQPAEE